MAISMEDRLCARITPLRTDLARVPVSQARRAPRSDSLPVRPVCPVSACGRPRPVLPSTDEERVSEIDHQALADLKPFDSQPSPCSVHMSFGSSTRPLDASFSSPSLQPLNTFNEGRRHTVASPTSATGPWAAFDTPVSPAAARLAGRRRSAPSTGVWLRHAQPRRGSHESGTHRVVPKQLDRPPTPLILPCGVELWWPVQPNGDIKVHVAVTSRSGVAEKLTKCFHPAELHASALPPTPAAGTLSSDGPGPFPAPGTVLPVPGSSPQTSPLAALPGRRFSIAASPTVMSPRSPRLGRRNSNVDFSGECIGESIKRMPRT